MVQVVVLWIFGFAFVALVGVPFVQVLTGLDAPSTSAWQVTSFTFCIDIMEFLVAFGVVRATLREFDLTRLNLWKVKVRKGERHRTPQTEDDQPLHNAHFQIPITPHLRVPVE